jgi:HAD superfamily hydrolase (TIGR01509 family)
MPFTALIFDFDGVMVDTEQSIFDAYRDIFTDHGAVLALATWETIIGSTGHRDLVFADLESQIGREVDREALRLNAQRLHHGISSTLPAVDGVSERIADAERAGLALGVSSSSTRSWVAGHLTRLGLIQHFGAVCTREDVTHTKPDPALYALAVERLGVRPQDAIALEDSPNGIASAKAAGLFCVAIPNPLTKDMSLKQADLHVESMAALSLETLAAHLDA